MKHSFKITLILLTIFILAQFIGLGVVYNYIDQPQTTEQGKVTFKELPVGERPPMDEKTSFIPLTISIIIGTILLLFLLKYNLTWIWKIWFFVAVFMSLTVAIGAFLYPM